MGSSKTFLVLVGAGQFAQAFASGIEKMSREQLGFPVHPVSWGNRVPVSSGTKLEDVDREDASNLVFLHLGSGREFQDVYRYCEERKILLIEASTAKLDRPGETSFPFIEAPNLSLPIIKFFKLLERGDGLLRDPNWQIVESHQASKKSLPGTALKFAEILGVEPTKIESIREPGRQKTELNIPEPFLDGHAVHRLTLSSLGAEISFGTRVMGRETYLRGLLEILRIRKKLQPRHYFVSDLIDEGWI